MNLCKLYKNCVNSNTCPYSKPTYKTLRQDSVCYDLVSEQNYNIYLRSKKLKKLNEKI